MNDPIWVERWSKIENLKDYADGESRTQKRSAVRSLRARDRERGSRIGRAGIAPPCSTRPPRRSRRACWKEYYQQNAGSRIAQTRPFAPPFAPPLHPRLLAPRIVEVAQRCFESISLPVANNPAQPSGAWAWRRAARGRRRRSPRSGPPWLRRRSAQRVCEPGRARCAVHDLRPSVVALDPCCAELFPDPCRFVSQSGRPTGVCSGEGPLRP